VIATLGGIAGVYALGASGERPAPTTSTTPPPPITAPTAPPAPADLAPLAGAWWGEGGVAYDGVVVGETVELRFRDPELLALQGHTPGETAYVLRPGPGSAHELLVEARVRPSPPPPYVYDHARAGATCVISLTHAAGKPLKAVEAIDKLVIQSVKVEPALTAFTRVGLRIVGCSDLAEARAVDTEIELGRTPTHPAPKWVPHDAGAGDAGAVHDAGAAHDAGAPRDAGAAHEPAGGGHDAGAHASPGKGYGAPCVNNMQCASHRCVATMCQ
jgi:hypothetical protein